jgi:adenosylcobinamide-GDP ribazoletransferase
MATGALAALLWTGAQALGLGSGVCALLALASSVLVTGALHEDGLADAADGLGGAHGGKRALEIMKDSRIGSYGGLALAFSLLFRLEALRELPQAGWFWLVEIHCLARIGPVCLMHTEPYVSDQLQSKSARLFPIGRAQLLAALCWGVGCSVLGIGAGWVSAPTVAAVALGLGLLTWGAARYFRSAVGGVTGDLLGALEQVCEIAAWLTWLVCHGA